MNVYTYDFPEDHPEKLIGVYDKASGDSPHDLKVFGYKESWRPPALHFTVPASRLDPVPATNLPVHVFRDDLASEIARIDGDEVVIIPLRVTAAKEEINGFSIVHPHRKVAIWDLEKSKWRGLGGPDWPKDQPMFMQDMVLKDKIEEFKVAYNRQWSSMLLFNEAVASTIRVSRSWVKVFIPQHYRND